jgi:nicotinamide-nucleotide amidase
MTAALLSIGSELLRGEVTDTNATWLAEQLTGLGFEVVAKETVADSQETIAAALKRLADGCSLLVVTGGLGPTPDDVTAAAAAKAAGRELTCNEDALATIRRRVERRGGELKPSHEKQAMLPLGAELLANSIGTAPGFVVRTERATTFFLPGVPQEMKRMFAEQVEPRVQGTVTNSSYQVVLHTYGAGESWISEQLEGLGNGQSGVTVGYLALPAGVDVKVLINAGDYSSSRALAEKLAGEARGRLGQIVYGEGDDTMISVAGRCVRTRGWRLAVAESCTGGLISKQLTAVPASDFFVGSAVTYANTAKAQVLGVSEDALRGHGAVSAEVAAEMAEGARRTFGCEVAISVTGIAGPSGATPKNPVGMCHWAVAHPGGTVLDERLFRGDRNQVQQQAAFAALDLLRRTISSNGG